MGGILGRSRNIHDSMDAGMDVACDDRRCRDDLLKALPFAPPDSPIDRHARTFATRRSGPGKSGNKDRGEININVKSWCNSACGQGTTFDQQGNEGQPA